MNTITSGMNNGFYLHMGRKSKTCITSFQNSVLELKYSPHQNLISMEFAECHYILKCDHCIK